VYEGTRDDIDGFYFGCLVLLVLRLQSLLITINTTRTYKPYSATADLHTFQFTLAHLLEFSVSTSHFLAMDLNTETVTLNHYEVFLSSLTLY
jgi:hypothetical protein